MVVWGLLGWARRIGLIRRRRQRSIATRVTGVVTLTRTPRFAAFSFIAFELA